MTDQTIPADKVRHILDEWERIKEYADWEDMDNLVQDVRALLPLPTLADMTHGERRECRWMQCDVIGWSERPVIVPIHHNDGTVMVICEDGTTDTLDTRQVTPRPDLPRLEWPGNKKPAPVLPDGWRLADHPDYGRVIVTNPKPDADGDVWFVRPDTYGDPEGYESRCGKADELTYIDQEADQ